MSPSSVGLPFCSLTGAAGRNERRGAAGTVASSRRPASRPAHDRSTSRFASGRACPERVPHGARPVDVQPTSAWVSSGCLCRPGRCRGTFRRTVFRMRFAVLAGAPASIGSSARPCGRADRTDHRPCPCPLSHGQVGIQGFELHPMACAVECPSRICVRSGCEDSAPRRGGGQAARESMQLSWVFLLPSRV